MSATTIFVSPKGGNCTTVTASAHALLSAQRGSRTLLIDLCGDVPAVVGMVEPDTPGINDWLGESTVSDAESMVRLGTPYTDGLVVLHRGARFVEGAPRWSALAEAVASIPHDVYIDAGTGFVPDAFLDAVGNVVMVTRPCYLSLKKATRMRKPRSVCVIREDGRALSVDDVGNVIGAPVSAVVPYEPAISRAVDAGLLASRVEQLLGRHIPIG